MFTTLIYGFCAYMVTIFGQPLTSVGYVSGSECVSHVSVGDTGADAMTYGEHTLGVKILEGTSPAAEVTIDGLHKFVVFQGERA